MAVYLFFRWNISIVVYLILCVLLHAWEPAISCIYKNKTIVLKQLLEVILYDVHVLVIMVVIWKEIKRCQLEHIAIFCFIGKFGSWPVSLITNLTRRS